VQDLGGSIARQPAQAGQGKYSIAWTSSSVYEWALVGGQAFCSLFHEFEFSLVQDFELFREFSLFQEFHKIGEIQEFWVPRSLLGDWLQISRQVVRKLYGI